MKKKNFLIVLSMIMLSLILFGSVVDADKKQPANLSISVNSTAVKKGDEVELSISGTNMSMGTELFDSFGHFKAV